MVSYSLTGQKDKKGMITGSYRRTVVGLDGRIRETRYENPILTESKRVHAGMFNTAKGANPAIDRLFEKLYSENVVIRTAEGFHYGSWRSYDGKSFRLGSHYFGHELIDDNEYGYKSFFGKDKNIQLEDVISIKEIPRISQKRIRNHFSRKPYLIDNYPMASS